MALVYNSVNALEFEDCGSKQGSFSSIVLSNCDPATMDFCPLKKSENVTIEVTFTPSEEVTKVKAVVFGYIAGIPTPFLLPNSDGCTNSGLTCPLAKQSQNKYFLTLPIKSYYPKVKVDIEFSLKDQARQNIVCAMIPARIV